MLSRVADSFYWIRRYLERAEHSARVILVHQRLTLDDPTNVVGRRLLAAVGEAPIGSGPPARLCRIAPVSPACVAAARDNARQIREQISSEMWEQLNSLYLGVRDAARHEDGDAGSFMRSVIEGTHLFHGVTEATLSHGEGWHYMQLGRYIERATTTASMLEAYFPEPHERRRRRPRPTSASTPSGSACCVRARLSSRIAGRIRPTSDRSG